MMTMKIKTYNQSDVGKIKIKEYNKGIDEAIIAMAQIYTLILLDKWGWSCNNAMKLAEDEVFVISTDPITGAAQDIGALAVQITVNDLASTGAEPIGIMLTVLLPENAEEKD